MDINGGVETLCSKLKGERQPVEIINLKTKKKLKRVIKDKSTNENSLNSKINENVNLRKLQNEILKFTTNFDTRNSKAKEQLAIKLGAKPRKKENINYKELKEKLRKDAETKKNQEKLFQLPKTMVRTSKTNKRPIMKINKESDDIIKNYGKIKNKK